MEEVLSLIYWRGRKEERREGDGELDLPSFHLQEETLRTSAHAQAFPVPS